MKRPLPLVKDKREDNRGACESACVATDQHEYTPPHILVCTAVASMSPGKTRVAQVSDLW